jgi:hypothetical protein
MLAITTIRGRPVAGIRYPPAFSIHPKQNKSRINCRAMTNETCNILTAL